MRAAMSCRNRLLNWPLTSVAANIKSAQTLSLPSSHRYMGTWPKIRPIRIRVITMDVTGTIVSFRGTLEEHYLGAAEKCGVDQDKLHQLSPTGIHKAFNSAYKECSELYPCFGGDQLSAKEWWRICVNRSFQMAGVEMNETQQEQVFQRIYSTFGGHAAYESFPDAKPFLAWANRNALATGILSNADERYGDSILPMVRNVLYTVLVILGSFGVWLGLASYH